MAFRWKKDYGHALERAVNQYNAARSSTLRHDRSAAAYLPGKADYNAIKAQVRSAADLQRAVNSLERFAAPAARQAITTRGGATMSRWERAELARQASVANQRFARETKRNLALDVTVGGKPAGYKRGQMPTAREAEFAKRNYNIENARPSDIADLRERLRRQSAREYLDVKKNIMRENYISKVERVFGKDRAAGLVKKIRGMSPDNFVKQAMSEQLADFDNLYIIEAQELDDMDIDYEMEILKAAWGDDES